MELLCLPEKPSALRGIREPYGNSPEHAHRLLLSLEKVGWVTRDASSERFRPGVHFFLLHRGDLFHGELIRIAGPEMERLVRETGKTAVMSVLEGTTGLCIHHVEPKGTAVKYVAHRGRAFQSTWGHGKAAASARRLRERILPRASPRLWTGTRYGGSLRRSKAGLRLQQGRVDGARRGHQRASCRWQGGIRGRSSGSPGGDQFRGQEEALVAKSRTRRPDEGALQSVFRDEVRQRGEATRGGTLCASCIWMSPDALRKPLRLSERLPKKRNVLSVREKDGATAVVFLKRCPISYEGGFQDAGGERN